MAAALVESTLMTTTTTRSNSTAGGTALQHPFVFSYMRRGKGGGPTAAVKPEGAASAAPESSEAPIAAAPATTTTSSTTTTTTAAAAATPTTAAQVHQYENAIKTIATVATVEGFWGTYNFLKRPHDLPGTLEYHFFREGIKPTWEDPSNAKGGKWIVRLPKGLASRYWEEIMLALIGGQWPGLPEGEVCGAVLSIRYNEDILGVWNRTAQDRDVVDRLRDAIKKILQLPPVANMEYKPHQTSMQDKSSFRNTQVWKPKSLEGRSSTTGGHASATSGGGGGSSGSSHHHHNNSTSTNTNSAHNAASAGPSSLLNQEPPARRSNSWGEREGPPRSKSREAGRAWR